MVFPRIPSSEDLWKRHEGLVLEVFEEALKRLQCRKDLPDSEDAISKILSKETRDTNFNLNEKGRGLTSPPNWEQPIPPKSEEDLEPKKKNKRPDFTCPFRDYNALSSEDAYLDYHIECKRLGSPTKAAWNLNKNYVTNGIVRFLDSEFNYGKDVTSGAMIGYIQNMDFESIPCEVNKNIADRSEHNISPLEGWQHKKHISKTSQSLDRLKVPPSSFELRHLWVDLRKKS